MSIQDIKSEDFKDLICIELDKDLIEDVSDEDLNQIEDFTLNRYNISGELSDINLQDIQSLKNLKSLTVNSFDINNDIISIINNMPYLELVQFSSCNFKTNLSISPKIKNLIVDSPNSFNESIINNNESIRIINHNFDLRKIVNYTNIKDLYLQNCNIANIEMLNNYTSLELLNIDGSKISNEEFLKQLSQKIEIQYSNEFHPMGQGNF